MYISKQEEIRDKGKAAGLTALLFTLLLLFLIFYQMITPNPPFPLSGGGGGMEMALGMMDVGNDVVDYQNMGAAQSVIVSEDTKSEELLTDENSDVAIKENDKKTETPEKEIKPNQKNETVVIKPIVKEKTLAEKLAEKYKNQTGKNSGGVGNNGTAGQQGSPDGNPNGSGNGGTGTGDGGGNGSGDGPGTGPGKGPGSGGGYQVSLNGRSVIKPPTLPKDTKEEGKVVVDILVDSDGHVIEASPNGRGTTTTSALLKAKARQAALATKFDVKGNVGEQRGTITIIFAFD